MVFLFFALERREGIGFLIVVLRAVCQARGAEEGSILTVVQCRGYCCGLDGRKALL